MTDEYKNRKNIFQVAIIKQIPSTTTMTVCIVSFRSQVIIHEEYNRRTLDNDIALVQLAEPIVFPSNNTIAPVCLPTPGNLYENVLATITGWGTLSSGKP